MSDGDEASVAAAAAAAAVAASTEASEQTGREEPGQEMVNPQTGDGKTNKDVIDAAATGMKIETTELGQQQQSSESKSPTGVSNVTGQPESAYGEANKVDNLTKGEEGKTSEVAQTPRPSASTAALEVKKTHVSVIARADGAPDIDGSSSTMFILDLVRQKREKVMRKKKDDMINEMALKKKRQMEEAKRKGKPIYAHSFGGFVGVGALVKPTKDEGKSPRVQRKAMMDEVVAVPSDSKSRAIFESGL